MRHKTLQLVAVLCLPGFVVAAICLSFGFAYASPAPMFFIIAGLLLTWWRPARPGQMLAIAAAASVLLAVALYFVSLQVVIIENRSGQPVIGLDVAPRENGFRTYSFRLPKLPNGYTFKFKFHDLLLCGGVGCSGRLGDGTQLGWDGIDPDQACHHTTRIAIGPHGVCHYGAK